MLGRDFTHVRMGFTPRMARIANVEEPGSMCCFTVR